jgi:2-iminobutanoate/2-iminopropanoate deaminase
MIQTVSTDKAPKAIGPYSQAIVANGLVFCSGQIPLDPASMTMVTGTIGDQTRQVLENLTNVLKQAGSDLTKVVKTTVYLKDMADFEQVNAVYGEFFVDNKPARACVAVAKLPKDAGVEIDAIALI